MTYPVYIIVAQHLDAFATKLGMESACVTNDGFPGVKVTIDDMSFYINDEGAIQLYDKFYHKYQDRWFLYEPHSIDLVEEFIASMCKNKLRAGWYRAGLL